MKINLRRQAPEIVRIKRYQFEHGTIKADFIKYLYHSHQLDRLAPFINMDDAKYGRIPNNFDIHHIHPLAYGGENVIDNLALVERKLHQCLHESIIDKQISEALIAKQKELDAFLIPQVCLTSDFSIYVQKRIERYVAKKLQKANETENERRIKKQRPFDKTRSAKIKSLLRKDMELLQAAKESERRMQTYVPKRVVLTPMPKKFVKRLIWRCSKLLHGIGRQSRTEV